VAAVAVAIGVLLSLDAHKAGSRAPTYAELVAKNYRVLTPSKSKLLVRFARRVYRCVAACDAGVFAPVASPTRITMRAPHRSARALLHLLVACDHAVGAPPAKATLQARPGQILVYLPKWCLLDRKVLPVPTP
jgi:hypothetical protein